MSNLKYRRRERLRWSMYIDRAMESLRIERGFSPTDFKSNCVDTLQGYSDKLFIAILCYLVCALSMTISVCELVSFNIVSESALEMEVNEVDCEMAGVEDKDCAEEVGASDEDNKCDACVEEVGALFLNDLGGDQLQTDIVDLDFSNVFDDISCETVACNVLGTLTEPAIVPVLQERAPEPVSTQGLREIPDPALVNAGKGIERLPSEKNDCWARKRADLLRKVLGMNLSVGLGDLPLEELDKLFSSLFARATKTDGSPYPSATLMNMMNGFNRIIRRASEVRSLKKVPSYSVGQDFNINSHPAFAATRMVLKAAIKKSAKDGVNKKRIKVETLTKQHEVAILADVDHQISSSYGCQKRLAFFCLVRMGLRGGQELWELQRKDLQIQIDNSGREYVLFEERESKNNSYSLTKYNKEQFRPVYHSFEHDFVVTLKRYQRHQPAEKDCLKTALFMQPIANPVGLVWYNKVHKVGRDTAAGWLKNMAKLVGLPPDLFSNRSGRATLITRMAAKGVLDHVGMLINGHHSTGGYLRYDRTQKLKMETAALVASNPSLDYEKALTHVSKTFVEEKLVGSAAGLKPLVDRVIEKPTVQPALQQIQVLNEQGRSSTDSVPQHVETSAIIDWLKEIESTNPFLFERMSRAPPKSRVSVGSNVSRNSFHNCTVTIKMVKPMDTDDEEKENVNTYFKDKTD